jgi:high-affinity nickel permease
MMPLISFLILGFFLGMRHATDADHVIAVTTIVSRERSIRNAAMVGSLWGIGHTLTLLLVGGAIVLFGLVISPRLGQSLEFSVALMLICLGFWNFVGFTRWTRRNIGSSRNVGQSNYLSELQQSRDESLKSQEVTASTTWLDAKFSRLGFYHLLRPLLVGVVHGLAGSAAVALLVLPMMYNPMWAVGYLLVFGVGTIGGMMLITAAIAWPFTYTANRSAAVHHYLGFASGFLSVAFGLFLVYQIGFVDGLLTK